MPATIKISNYAELNILEKTELAADLPIGSTQIVTVNNQNIGANSTVLIGSKGAETGQLISVTSATGATILVSAATTIKHFSGDPVYSLFGTKLRIYSAPNTNNLPPADGTYILVDTISIDPDQLETLYTHPAGSSALWYKFTYLNATLNAETALADAVASRSGGGYASLYDIRQEAGFAEASYISEILIDQKRKTAQAQIDGALSGQYQTPFDTPVNDTIREITLQLAAGLLQLTQFGRYTTQDTNNGQLRVDWAEKQIEKIKSGQLVLVGVDGLPDNQTINSGASGYPTEGSLPGFMFERSFIEVGERHY